MNFDYYYGDESNQFAFYRIPRQLITGEAFKKLSTDAKLYRVEQRQRAKGAARLPGVYSQHRRGTDRRR